jgi:hypothetical protein
LAFTATAPFSRSARLPERAGGGAGGNDSDSGGLGAGLYGVAGGAAALLALLALLMIFALRRKKAPLSDPAVTQTDTDEVETIADDSDDGDYLNPLASEGEIPSSCQGSDGALSQDFDEGTALI